MSMLMGSRRGLATPRLETAAAALDAAAVSFADLSTADIMRNVDSLVGELEGQRNRLIVDSIATGVFNGETGDSARTLIATIENFMADRVPRMEARVAAAAEPEARALAVRLQNACVNILRAVRGFSPSDLLLDNVVQTVKEAADDVKDLGKGTMVTLIVVAVAVAVVAVIYR